jgi:hypothetical protein
MKAIALELLGLIVPLASQPPAPAALHVIGEHGAPRGVSCLGQGREESTCSARRVCCRSGAVAAGWRARHGSLRRAASEAIDRMRRCAWFDASLAALAEQLDAESSEAAEPLRAICQHHSASHGVQCFTRLSHGSRYTAKGERSAGRRVVLVASRPVQTRQAHHSGHASRRLCGGIDAGSCLQPRSSARVRRGDPLRQLRPGPEGGGRDRRSRRGGSAS